MHFTIWSAELPDGQVFKAGRVPWYDEMTDGMARALVDVALAEGWQPAGCGLEGFRLDPDLAGDALYRTLLKSS